MKKYYVTSLLEVGVEVNALNEQDAVQQAETMPIAFEDKINSNTKAIGKLFEAYATEQTTEKIH